MEELLQQVIGSASAYIGAALKSTTGLAVAAWGATEAVSCWNKFDSRKSSVLLTVGLSVAGWFGGYWNAHTWVEAIFLTQLAWMQANVFHAHLGGMGRVLSAATIRPLAEQVGKVYERIKTNGTGNGASGPGPTN